MLSTITLSIHAVCWKSFGTYWRELYCAISSSSASETAATSPAATSEEALLRSGSVKGPPFRESDTVASHSPPSPLAPPSPSPSPPAPLTSSFREGSGGRHTRVASPALARSRITTSTQVPCV